MVHDYCVSIPNTDDPDPASLQAHNQAIERLLEQMVRDEPAGTTRQHPIVRRIERFVRGDARQAGEVHRWMYDRYTLRGALRSGGFDEVRDETPLSSRICDWSSFCLDVNADGSACISGSLYVEAAK